MHFGMWTQQEGLAYSDVCWGYVGLSQILRASFTFFKWTKSNSRCVLFTGFYSNNYAIAFYCYYEPVTWMTLFQL